MLRRIYDRLRKLWYKLVTLKSSPRRIALGFALGVFLAYTPTFGVQMPLALGMATVLKVNPISCLVGTYLTNVFTVWPIYVLCHGLGSWVTGVESVFIPRNPEPTTWWSSLVYISKLGLQWVALELLGATICGTLSAVAAYFLMLFAVIRYRTVRLNRRIRRVRARIMQAQQEAEERSRHPSGDSADRPA